jgi:alanine dehydrogenase
VIIGVPTETKVREYRVGMVPAGVRALATHGHTVLVQKGAGAGSGIADEAYVAAGATLRESAAEVWGEADLVVKVKEPLPSEYALIREGQIIYTYFHLAAVPELAKVLLEKKVAAMAYETIQTDDGRLPLLKPMSEVAGKMSIQVGAMCLERGHGGLGVLLGGVPGVRRGRVTILGGGIVGTNAAKVAVGMGAEVRILDLSLDRLEYLDDVFRDRVATVYSDLETIEESVTGADLVVGAVLVPGAKAPRLVTRDLISKMREGSVVVDVAVDQGGCIETCRPTTHDDPTYVVDGVVHYCVANMPGAVSHTSTFALTNATIRYCRALADQGLEAALRRDRVLARGLNAYQGKITHEAVAESLELPYAPLEEALGR